MSLDRRQYAVAYGASSASASPTFASAVLVGSTIIVITCSQFPVVSVTDNKSNGYTVDARATQNGSHIGIFRAYVVTGGSGLTVTGATGSPGPIVMSVQEVPNALIVDQTNAGVAITAGVFSIQLTGRTSQTQNVYAVQGSDVSLTGIVSSVGWGNASGSPWGSVASSANGLPSRILDTLDASFSWTSTSGALVAAGGIRSGTGTALVVICMATYIEDVAAGGGGGAVSQVASHDPWSGTLVPGLPYPPMLGSPWAVQSRPPRPIEPAPPSPAVAREQPMLLSAGGGSPARKERDSRALALIANALLRSEQLQQSSDSEFGILTGGFDADRAPTEDDDATAGVSTGVPWLDSSGSARKAETLETNPGPDVYFCVEDQAGVATWFRVATRSDGRVTGGASGSFP